MIKTNKPLIAATTHLPEELPFLAPLAGEKIIDIIEFRADRFYRGETEPIVEILSRLKSAGLPVILTFRGGEVPGLSESKRLAILEELLPGADAVDIELGAEITEEAVLKAGELSKTVIISEHDFEGTPEDNKLENIFEKGIAARADIVKIAVMPRAPEDAARLMCFCMRSSEKHPLICISMGEIGRFTRFYAPFFGSLVTYGSISEPVAPGQVDARELKRELGKFFQGGRLLK